MLEARLGPPSGGTRARQTAASDSVNIQAEDTPAASDSDAPQRHRTIDRVTQIVEEVVYRPGMTFTELVRALDAAKSTVHSFIQGLLAKGWLFETNGRFYLGPALYGLTLASGQVRAGSVSYDDLARLHDETGLAAFLGVRAGDHLIYVSEVGSDPVSGFDARTNIRRDLIKTAGGKALLAAATDSERMGYLRRLGPEFSDAVHTFLDAYPSIVKTGVATNSRRNGMRCALAVVLHDDSGHPVASVTLVGPTDQVQPRMAELAALLQRRVGEMEARHAKPREAI